MNILKSFCIATVLSAVLFGGYFINLYHIRDTDRLAYSSHVTLADVVTFSEYQKSTGEAFLWPLLIITGIIVSATSTLYFIRKTTLARRKRYFGAIGLFLLIFLVYIVTYWLLRGYFVQDLFNISLI